MSFTILIRHLLVHSLTFLFVVFIVIGLCPILHSSNSLIRLYFSSPPPLPPKPFKKFIVCDYALVISNLFEFFHYYFCAFCNMATFLVPRCLDFTIIVDNLGMAIIFKHCLCIMFVFQLGSLHISKDFSYDSNNFVLSSLYQIPMTFLQGK